MLRSKPVPQQLCPPAATYSRVVTVSTIGLGTSDGWPSVQEDVEDQGECALAEMN